MQEWVQQVQQQPVQARNHWASSGLTEHEAAPGAFGDSDFLLFSSFGLPTSSDFTNLFDTSNDFDLGVTMAPVDTNFHTSPMIDGWQSIEPIDGLFQQSHAFSESTQTQPGPLHQQSASKLQFPTFTGDETSSTNYTPITTDLSTTVSPNGHKRKSSSPSSTSISGHVEVVHKRQRNTEAARRYRQRKVDRVTELEEALASMAKDRDDLRLKLARSEAEADVLRGIVGKRA